MYVGSGEARDDEANGITFAIEIMQIYYNK